MSLKRPKIVCRQIGNLTYSKLKVAEILPNSVNYYTEYVFVVLVTFDSFLFFSTGLVPSYGLYIEFCKCYFLWPSGYGGAGRGVFGYISKYSTVMFFQ